MKGKMIDKLRGRQPVVTQDMIAQAIRDKG